LTAALRGEAFVHLDDFIERVRHLPRESRPVLGQSGAEVPFAHGPQREEQFGGVDGGVVFEHGGHGVFSMQRSERGSVARSGAGYEMFTWPGRGTRRLVPLNV